MESGRAFSSARIPSSKSTASPRGAISRIESELTAALHRALDLLNRASADWRNGAAYESGSLHWPVAVTLARSELRKALEALDRESRPTAGALVELDPDTDDSHAGMAWYNAATITERRHWHEVARSAVPADAWEAWKAGGSQP